MFFTIDLFLEGHIELKGVCMLDELDVWAGL